MSVSRFSGVCVSAGVDWLTATYKIENGLEKPRDIALGLAEVEQSAGEFARPLSWKGYEGFQCGHLLYGERMDGSVVQVSGVLACAHWQRLFECASNVTRVDLQGTFRIDGEPKTVITNHYRQMKQHALKFARAPQPALFIGRDDSRTVYTGSPASDRKGRIYDKGLESGMVQFQNCVRYELVLQKKRALAVARGLSRDVSDFPRIAKTSLSFFEHRGAHVECLANSYTDVETIVSSNSRRKQSNCDEVLKWLSMAVAPSVSRLVNRGLLDQVLLALGLTDVVQPVGNGFGSLLTDTKEQEPYGSISSNN